MRSQLLVGAVVLGTSLSALPARADNPAPAEQPPPAAPERKGVGPLFGVKVGGLLPFSGLGPNAQVGVELGIVLPVLHRGLAIGVGVDYAQPVTSGTTSDPRVVGGTYDWQLKQQFLTFMPMILYRLTTLKVVTPFIGVGPRIYLMQSTVHGDAGAANIPDTTEVSTRVGVGVPLGVEFKLGPGGILAELLAQWGPYEHTATGDTHTGALSLSVGYRLAM